MYRPEPVDAVAPNPKTGELVYLNGRMWSRSPLESAWLALQETDGDRMSALKAVLPTITDWRHGTASEYVTAAEGWTGNVVAGEVR